MNQITMPKIGETIKLGKMVFSNVINEKMSVCKTWILDSYVHVTVKDILYNNILLGEDGETYRINMFSFGDDFFVLCPED